MKCLSLHSADIAQDEMALDLPLRRTNTGQKSLSFFGQKI